MSMILDALKKSETDRKAGETDAAPDAQPEAGDGAAEPKRSKWLWIGVVGFCAVVLGGAVAHKFLVMGGGEPTPEIAAPPAPAGEKPVEQAKAEPPAAKPAAPESAAAEPKHETTPPPAETADTAAPTPATETPKPAPEPEPKPEPVAASPALEPKAEPEAEAEAKVTPAPPPPALVPIAPLPRLPEPLPAPKTVAKVPTPKPALAGVTPPRKSTQPAAPRLSADEYSRRAQAFEADGQLEKAVAEYGLALARDPRLAEARVGRGWARVALGDAAGAVADFDAALDADPDSAEVHFARGWAREKAGRRVDAVADYTAAIELAPGFLDAHMSRGVLTFYDGDFEAAADDFAEVYAQDDGALGDYALIWQYISTARSGAAKPALEAAFAERWQRTDWPGTVYALLRGRASAADVLRWTDDPKPARRRELQCVAYFFLGQAHLLAGDEAAARDYFEKTLATRATSYRQYDAARVELDRMGN